MARGNDEVISDNALQTMIKPPCILSVSFILHLCHQPFICPLHYKQILS